MGWTIGRVKGRLRVSCSLVVLAGSDEGPQESLCGLAAELSFRMPLNGKNMRVFGMFHRLNESVAGDGGRNEIWGQSPDALMMFCGHYLSALSENFC